MRRRLRAWKDSLVGSPLERATRYATFVSETGYELPLYRLHRYLAVPRLLWRGLSLRSAPAGSDPETQRLVALVEAWLGDPRELDYLEVGVGRAAKAESLAPARFRSRTCTDLRDYYDDDSAPEQEERFRASGIRFVWDDIERTALAPKSFDVLACWDVLEHLPDPRAFFASARALLRPGGLLCATYNPFFALSGGHSAAITDAHWGHALLTPADLERYFRRHHPAHAERALRFLTRSLNRMTLAGLAAFAAEHGFETLELERETQPGASRLVDAALLAQLGAVHPSARPEDLATREVRLVLRRGSDRRSA
jgi:SAM-dependent methyltransferase